MRILLPLLCGGPIAYVLWQLLDSEAHVTTKLLIALPLCGLLSVAFLSLAFPTSAGSGTAPAFWRPRPGGLGAPAPNLAHPAAKYVVAGWVALALAWLGALAAKLG